MPELYKEQAFPKKCDCGIVHTELKWKRLKVMGVQSGYGFLTDFEMRDCVCGSTIGVPIVMARDLGPRKANLTQEVAA